MTLYLRKSHSPLLVNLVTQDGEILATIQGTPLDTAQERAARLAARSNYLEQNGGALADLLDSLLADRQVTGRMRRRLEDLREGLGAVVEVREVEGLVPELQGRWEKR